MTIEPWAIGVAAAYALSEGAISQRRYSIFHLGRFFTVNLAIAEDHCLVDTGPYTWVRHPSYTGWLIAIPGLGLGLGHWISVAVLMVATLGVILWRIAIEEKVLRTGPGEVYATYASKTWRLVPFVY